MQKVGFIGIGQIGYPLCLGLARAGVDVFAFDLQLRQDRAVGLREAGAHVASTLEEAVTDRTEIIIALPDSDAVDAVVLSDALAGLAPGTLIIDMGTSLPARTKRLGQTLATRGVRLVDAPICNGGTPGAYEGRNLVCLGGDTDDVARARNLLELFTGSVLHVGPLGAGHAIKVINNSIGLAVTAIHAEGVALGVAYGLDPAAVVATLNQCSSSGVSFATTADRYLGEPPSEADFRVELASKDIRYSVILAGELGAPHGVTDAAHAFYVGAERLLGSGADTAYAPSQAMRRLGSRSRQHDEVAR